MKKKVYISTPIYYASGKPHIGHAYTTILADVIKGYKELFNEDVCFVTGLDEHGQKIQEKAEANNMTPIAFVNNIEKEFVDLWKRLDINYDCFVRTTNEAHTRVIQEIFTKFLVKNKIYLNDWKGYYCPGCEENKSRKELIQKEDGLYCDIGHKVEEKNEESYFFKMKDDVKWLVDEFFKHTNIAPLNRKTELLNNFLNDLEDLSITRTKTSWGINVKENAKHTIYVWLDALFSYLTALGYMSDNPKMFKQYWNNQSEKIHLMSKEIIRFHCIYWPIFLKNLDLPLPNTIISHGWIVTKEGKMSKSLGNVIDPYYLIDTYGSDALRYFLMKEFSVFNDNVFCEDTFVEIFNADLANNVGNLTSRLLGMLSKYNNKIIPKFRKTNVFYYETDAVLKDAYNKIKSYLSEFKIDYAIKQVILVINYANKLIEDNKPWELFKDNKIDELNDLLNILFQIDYFVIYFLSPVLKKGTKEFLYQLNINPKKFNLKNLFKYSKFNKHKTNDSTPVYQRIIVKKET